MIAIYQNVTKSHLIVIGAAAVVFAAVYLVAQRNQRFGAGKSFTSESSPGAGHEFNVSEPRAASAASEKLNRHEASMVRSRDSAGAPAGATTGESTRSKPTSGQNVMHNSVSVEPKTVDSPLDFSLAGRQFPLSDSVRQTCSGQKNGGGECSDLWIFLKAFSEEPRDILWATDIESRVALFVENFRGGDAKVRKVECRKDRCVLEVEAPYQFIITEFEKDPTLSRELREGIGDLGFER